MADEFGKYVFYKDITPAFLDTDRSGSEGFTDTSRLETLLKDWGFSAVDVKEVTMWKISSKSQYVEDGPRLEWKGTLYVRDIDQLQIIKWKNKNKTKYNKSVRNSEGLFCLNDGATSYSGSEYVYIHISEIGFGMPNNRCFIWKDENGGEWTVDKSPLDYEYTEWSVNDSSEVKNKGKIIPFNTSIIQDLNGNEVLTEHLEKLASKVKINDGYRINNDRTLEIVAFNENTNKTKQDGQFIFGKNKTQIYGTGSNQAVPCFGAEPAVYPVVLFNNMSSTLNPSKLDSISFKKEKSLVSINDNDFTFNFDSDLLIMYSRTHGSVLKRTEVSEKPDNWRFIRKEDSSGPDYNLIFNIKEMPGINLELDDFDIKTHVVLEDYSSLDEVLPKEINNSIFNAIIKQTDKTYEYTLSPIAARDWKNYDYISNRYNRFFTIGSWQISDEDNSGDPEAYLKNGMSVQLKIKFIDFPELETTNFHIYTPMERSKYNSDIYDYYNNIEVRCEIDKPTNVSGYKNDEFFAAYFTYSAGLDVPPGTLPETISPFEGSYKINNQWGESKSATGKFSSKIYTNVDVGSDFMDDREYNFQYIDGDKYYTYREILGLIKIKPVNYQPVAFSIIRWVDGQKVLKLITAEKTNTQYKITIFNSYPVKLSYRFSNSNEFLTLEPNEEKIYNISYNNFQTTTFVYINPVTNKEISIPLIQTLKTQ